MPLHFGREQGVPAITSSSAANSVASTPRSGVPAASPHNNNSFSSSSSGGPAIPSPSKAFALLQALSRLPHAPIIAGEPVGLRPSDDSRSFAVHYRNAVMEVQRKTILSFIEVRWAAAQLVRPFCSSFDSQLMTSDVSGHTQAACR